MHNLTLAEIARNLSEKRFSAEELTRTLLTRIEQLDPQPRERSEHDLLVAVADAEGRGAEVAGAVENVGR